MTDMTEFSMSDDLPEQEEALTMPELVLARVSEIVWGLQQALALTELAFSAYLDDQAATEEEAERALLN